MFFGSGEIESTDFQPKRLSPVSMYVCMYVCQYNYLQKFPDFRTSLRKDEKDRDLSFCTSGRHILNARTVLFQVSNPSGSWFSRHPIFKVYTIMYNSAGKFLTTLKTFFSRDVFRLSVEQGASPPSSRGLRPREEGEGGPPVVLASTVITMRLLNCNNEICLIVCF